MRKCLKGDLSGKRFSNVTVVYESRTRDSHGHKMWACICDCGKDCMISSTKLVSCKNASCGCKKGFRKGISEITALNRLYDRYKYGAKHRMLPFDLTKEEVLELSKQQCYYCGTPPTQSMKTSIKSLQVDLIYNGIDRIDNTLGYVKGNCRTSCGFCNIAKGVYSEEIFLKYIKKINDKHNGSNFLSKNAD